MEEIKQIDNLKTNNLESNEKENSYKQNMFVETVKKEVKKEKFKLTLISIISFIFFAITITLGSIAAAISLEKLEQTKLPNNIFFHWLPQIGLSIIFLWILITSLLSLYKIKQEVKYFYSDNIFSFDRIPNFIKSSFKRGIAMKIFLNWFSIVSYIASAIFLSLIILINETQTINFFNITTLVVKTSEAQKNNLYWSMIITIIYIISIIILHMIFYILLTKKNTNLNIFFDLENKIDQNQIKIYKRNVNIFCAIFFLFPLIILFIVWWIKKRKKS